jgi:hypothetical protein
VVGDACALVRVLEHQRQADELLDPSGALVLVESLPRAGELLVVEDVGVDTAANEQRDVAGRRRNLALQQVGGQPAQVDLGPAGIELLALGVQRGQGRAHRPGVEGEAPAARRRGGCGLGLA